MPYAVAQRRPASRHWPTISLHASHSAISHTISVENFPTMLGRAIGSVGQPGDRFRIRVDFHEGRRHLPIVSLQRAA